MRLLSVFVFSAVAATTRVQAETLQLSGQQHWLALASDRNKDVAIGIARRQYNLQDSIRVVSSQNGYFAVIARPYQAFQSKNCEKMMRITTSMNCQKMLCSHMEATTSKLFGTPSPNWKAIV